MKMEQDPRFKHIEALVGAFVIAALIAIVAAVFYFGTDFDLLGKKYFLKFESDTGTGLTKGMPVKLSGFMIGRIHDVSLDDRAKVIVQIRIDQEYSKWIRTDSIATLLQEGLIGTSIIDISVGSPELPNLEENQFIYFHKQEAINDIALGLRESVNNVLTEVHNTISYINNPQGEVKRTIANIERLTIDLEETRRKADYFIMVGTDDAEKAALLLDNLAIMTGGLSLAIDNTTRRIPALFDQLEAALSNVENTSITLRTIAEQAAPKVYPILLETEELVTNTNEVVDGVRKTWPLRNHIPAKNKPWIVQGDSYD